ncbi:hypothetical protein Runsl_5069 [Runella slithyformis DSM 19594]|uniref:Uncharacterized protein n=1 Tax=Runella slithyformis (strain ATCC 29530 / DSM 19594 / LMG 11500 / NCIMB 11436 / LSU 4) TaxID=761193 RepID=A0A7U3ZQ92_RUNSL|nr:hypothetical protein Runsl_5069 [Runella slithyformis DSM 19594]
MQVARARNGRQDKYLKGISEMCGKSPFLGIVSIKSMRVLLLILGFGLAIISFDRQENTEQRIKSFDFSYDNVFSSCFSIKFTEGDTVFVRQHFTTSDIPRINTNYYAVLSKRDRNAENNVTGSYVSCFIHQPLQALAASITHKLKQMTKH